MAQPALFAETQLIGTLRSAINNTDSTPVFTVSFRDKNTGLARIPDANTKLWVLGRGQDNWEIFYGTNSTSNGITTITTIARGLSKSYSTTPLTEVSANKMAHFAAEEVSVVDVATYLNIIGLKLAGTDTIGNPLSVNTTAFSFSGAGVTNVPTFANTTARDAAITAPADGMLCEVNGALMYYGNALWNTITTGTVYTAGAGIGIAGGVISVDLTNTTKFVSTSAGAGDSGKVPRLNGSGILDTSFKKDTLANQVTGVTNATGAQLETAFNGGNNTITATALNTITGGSSTNADTYHTHTSLVTNVKNGVTTYDLTTASGTQTIAHGLGVTPKFIRITAYLSATVFSHGVYNGTTNSDIQVSAGGTNGSTVVAHLESTAGNYQNAVATFDATNITLAWTKTNSPTGTAQIMWEAMA